MLLPTSSPIRAPTNQTTTIEIDSLDTRRSSREARGTIEFTAAVLVSDTQEITSRLRLVEERGCHGL